jgi:hypothetical protein
MERRHGPYGLNQATHATFRSEKTLLVVVHHYTALTRLRDVVPLVEEDPRIQVVYTVAPTSVFAAAARERLERDGSVLIPWSAAVECRFDAAIAAGTGALDQLHAPVITLSHGHGPGKLQMASERDTPRVARSIKALTSAALTARGRVVPSVIGIAHERHRRLIEASVPEAGAVCRLVGDPCFDRILAGRASRERYRAALGVETDRRLVVVSSTWRRASLLGIHPDLPQRLVTQLSDTEHAVVVIPHPCTWAWHGHRQVRSWFAAAQSRGLGLLPPHEGWRAALIACDLVIGDHGSVTYYGAALGRPVVMGAFPAEDLHSEAAPLRLARQVPHLEPDRPLRPQVEAVLNGQVAIPGPEHAALLTSVPRQAARRLRRTLYEVLRLAEPAQAASSAAVPEPRLLALPKDGGEPL